MTRQSGLTPKIWRYEVKCNGREKAVSNCVLKEDKNNSCNEVAGVQCKPGNNILYAAIFWDILAVVNSIYTLLFDVEYKWQLW